MINEKHINESAHKMADGFMRRAISMPLGGQTEVHYTIVLSPEEIVPFIQEQKLQGASTKIDRCRYSHRHGSLIEYFDGADTTYGGRVVRINVDRDKVVALARDFSHTPEHFADSRVYFDALAEVYKSYNRTDLGTYLSTNVRLKGRLNANRTFHAAWIGSAPVDENKSFELFLERNGCQCLDEEMKSAEQGRPIVQLGRLVNLRTRTK